MNDTLRVQMAQARRNSSARDHWNDTSFLSPPGQSLTEQASVSGPHRNVPLRYAVRFPVQPRIRAGEEEEDTDLTRLPPSMNSITIVAPLSLRHTP